MICFCLVLSLGSLDVSEVQFGSGDGRPVSPAGLTEDELVEQPALHLLSRLGWAVASGYEEVLGSGGTLGRDSQSEPVLGHRLRDSLACSLNPGLPVRRRWMRPPSGWLGIGQQWTGSGLTVSVHTAAPRGGKGRDDRKAMGSSRTVTVRFVDWNRRRQRMTGWRCRSSGSSATCTSGGPTSCCS